MQYAPPVHSDSDTGALDALIDELARALYEPECARMLALRAGFLSADLPAFDVPRVFWSRVVRAAADGQTIGGVQALADEAANLFPGNEFLAGYRNQVATPVADLRTRYLERLRNYYEHRVPLHDIFRGHGVIDSRLSMLAIEQPVLIVSEARGPGATASRTFVLDAVLTERLTQGQRPLLTVLGDVGTGKSTLLEQTMAQLTANAAKSADAPLPWLVAAADLARLPEKRVGRYHDLQPEQQLRSRLDTRWLPLIDGYDEVAAGNHSAVDAAIRRLLDDRRIQAVVIVSRPVAEPRMSPPVDRYRVAPWNFVQGLHLAATWSQTMGTAPLPPERAREAHDLLSNPLTATLYLAFARQAGPSPTRAQLFSVLTESLFDTWASQRPATRALQWAKVAQPYQGMARILLQHRKASFSPTEVHEALAECVPDEVLRHSKTAEDLGLLLRRPDGSYEFMLRPIAEHLAGASLLDVEPHDLAMLATAAWAEEPVRHSIGLHALRGNKARARDCLLELAKIPANELDTIHAFRTATVAARAASDIGRDAEPVTQKVANALLIHLIDGSSTWRPSRAEAVVRTLIQGRGPMSSALRDGAMAYLKLPADGIAVDYHGHVKGLYHPEGVVRLETTRQLGSMRRPEDLNWLLAMLLDCGTEDRYRWSVAAEAALALRRMPRGPEFDEVKSILLSHLHSHHQAGSGAAAIALLPDEADPKCLARALRDFSSGYCVPLEVVDDLRQYEQGAAALQDFPIPSEKVMTYPRTEEIRAQAVPKRTTPSISTHAHLTRALGGSLLAEDGPVRAECIARARRGGIPELEALCEFAFDDPAPLANLLEEIVEHHRPGSVERGHPFLYFSPYAEQRLNPALTRHPRLLDALVALWVRTRYDHVFIGYPGRALEPFVQADRPEITRVYAEWLPSTFNNVEPPCDVPPRLQGLAEVQEAARHLVNGIVAQAFEGRLENGKRICLAPSVAGFLLSHLRPFWINDLELLDRLGTWIHSTKDTEMLAGLTALGPGGLPAFASDVVVSRLNAVGQDGDPVDLHNQITLMVFSANIALPSHSIENLRKIAISSHPARFAAGHAVIERLARTEASNLSSSLANTWPCDNWGFWYSRHNQVLPSLVNVAPASWANRAAKLDATWHLDLAQPLLTLLEHADQEPILKAAFRSARYRDLPWLFLGGPRPSRLADAVLELVYDSGLDVSVFATWCARLDHAEAD